VYQEQDELGLAQEAAERARAADPTRQEAELLLGSVAYARGELEGAAAHYRAAHALAPRAAQPLLNLANTLGDLYRKMEASTANQDAAARARMAAVNAESVAAYERMLLHNRPAPPRRRLSRRAARGTADRAGVCSGRRRRAAQPSVGAQVRV
jgi:tetratricopeptide (TPR) repeat protein